MGEQCRSRHPVYGVQCERPAEHARKALASERGTHRAELPQDAEGNASPQFVVRIVDW